MRNEANDAFTVRWRKELTRVRQPIRQPVDPNAAIRIEHDLDDARIFKLGSDRRSQRRAQHARAA
jgi:hypothetical protein